MLFYLKKAWCFARPILLAAGTFACGTVPHLFFSGSAGRSIAGSMILGIIAYADYRKKQAIFEQFLLEEIQRPRAGTYYKKILAGYTACMRKKLPAATAPLRKEHNSLTTEFKSLEALAGRHQGRRNAELAESIKKRKSQVRNRLATVRGKLTRITEAHVQLMDDLEALAVRSELLDTDAALDALESDDAGTLDDLRGIASRVEDTHEFLLLMEESMEDTDLLEGPQE